MQGTFEQNVKQSLKTLEMNIDSISRTLSRSNLKDAYSLAQAEVYEQNLPDHLKKKDKCEKCGR